MSNSVSRPLTRKRLAESIVETFRQWFDADYSPAGKTLQAADRFDVWRATPYVALHLACEPLGRAFS